MNVVEFIKVVLIQEIKEIQTKGHHYLSFGLISQGIELLGACIDNRDFQIQGKSRQRFNLAIKELFPMRYHEFVKSKGQQFDLYDNLRCGLLHIVVPGSDLELIQQSESDKFGNHLEIKKLRNQDRLILVSQILMDDFEKACNDVISRIETKTIRHKKVSHEFLLTS